MTTSNLASLVDGYVAVWNEPDPARRSAAVRELWTAEGVHHVRDRTYRGHTALEERVAGAYAKNVAPGRYRFRAGESAQQLHDVVTLTWHMVAIETDAIVATGLDVLVVDSARRIVTDYQFIL